MNRATGPLKGCKVIEFAGIGPGPFAGTMLSDMGADVLRIERLGAGDPAVTALDARGRYGIALDLKDPAAVERCLKLCQGAEIVFEGFRPGVMERLGLGPEAMLARNPRLVYGRMTGWGQWGPYSRSAGHDINYLAITGALHAIGTRERPVPPLNLVGDYGGGGMFLVAGLLGALLHARATGEGQVVDAGMSDGAAYLMSLFYGMKAAGDWQDQRAANIIDGGAPFYDTYRCADGKWIAIGSIEPQFYAALLKLTGATDMEDIPQMDEAGWPRLRDRLEAIFSSKSRSEWCALMEASDVCFAPVLSMSEAPAHPHNIARQTFIDVAGVVQPAPAPRFSKTPSAVRGVPAPLLDVDEGIHRWSSGHNIGTDTAAATSTGSR